VLRSARPLPTRRQAPGLRTPRATERSGSALVVSHHLDGLLRTDGASIVAARCRPWGSPRFPTATTCTDLLPREDFRQRDHRVSRVALYPAKIAPHSQRLPHSPSPPKRRCSREGAPPLPFTLSAPRLRSPPESSALHRGVLSNPARLRGLVPRTGLSPPSTVSSDRWLCPSMGFCSPSGHRTPTSSGWDLVERLAFRLRMADLREYHVKELHQGAFSSVSI
jgi:hypothetical protein